MESGSVRRGRRRNYKDVDFLSAMAFNFCTNSSAVHACSKNGLWSNSSAVARVALYK